MSIDDMSKINKIMAEAHGYPGRGRSRGGFLGGRGRRGSCGAHFMPGGHGGRRGGRGFRSHGGGRRHHFPTKPRDRPRLLPKGSSTQQLNRAMQASKPELLVGGRLRHFLSQWYNITSDPCIIDTVKGMHIDLKKLPKQSTLPPQLHLTQDEFLAAEAQIRTLLEKRAIVETTKGQPGEFISNIFLCPKKDKGYQVILNLKKFKSNVMYNHFKMETLHHILTLVTKNCYMSIFDLQDAYLVVAIAGFHVKFLKFEWQGKVYMYVVMPFGLAEAPRKFTKLLKPVLAKLRQAGIILAIYINDGWVKGQTYSRCLHNILVTVKLFAKLGFLLHKEKSALIPSQQVNILGFDVDSVAMLVTIGNEKTNKAIALCKDALCGQPIPIPFLAKVIGTLISLFPACPWG